VIKEFEIQKGFGHCLKWITVGKALVLIIGCSDGHLEYRSKKNNFSEEENVLVEAHEKSINAISSNLKQQKIVNSVPFKSTVKRTGKKHAKDNYCRLRLTNQTLEFQ